MPIPPTSTTASLPPAHWVTWRWVGSSYALSLLCHALVLLMCAMWMSRGERPAVGFGEGPFREVGLVLREELRPSATGVEADRGQDDETSPHQATTPETGGPPLTPDVGPLLGASMPETPATTVLGPGALAVANSTPDARDLVKPSGRATPGTTLAGATPGTAFLGVEDKGQIVVFVIDCSGSMSNHKAMQKAKAALVSSLNSLESTQQFQVVFYNESPRVLRLNNESRPVLYFATELNQTLARQEIAAVQPDRGTEHLPAMKAALKLRPDVLFFLTDADSEMDAGDRAEITRLNGGRAHIHCIEFGRYAEVKADNFLKKIARENEGTHRYFDVTKFDK